MGHSSDNLDIIPQEKPPAKVEDHRLQRLETLFGVINQIATISFEDTDFQLFLSRIFRTICDFFNFQAGGVYIVDGERGIATLQYQFGMEDEALKRVTTININTLPYSEIFLQRKPLYFENYGEQFPDRKDLGLQALASIPLICEIGVIGALNIASRQTHMFSEEEKQFLNIVSKEFGASIYRFFMQEQLRKTEERFRNIIEFSNDGVILADEEGNIIEWNNGQERTSGWSRDDVIGRKIWDVQFQLLDEQNKTDERYDQIRRIFAQVLKDGKIPLKHSEMRNPIRTKTGFERIIQHFPFSIKTPKGYQMCSITRDITEQVQAEDNLRHSEAKYRSIVEAAPWGMHFYELKPNGKLVLTGADPVADRMLKIDHNNLLGKTIEEAFPPLVNTNVPEMYRQVAITGQSWDVEQINYEDQKIRGAFEVHAFSIGPRQMVAAFIDITERKKSEDALRASEERYRLLFESASDLIAVTDPTDQIVDVSPSITPMLGFDPEEIKGMSFWNAGTFTPEQLKLMEEARTQLRAGIPMKMMLQELRSKTGQKVIIEVMATPIVKDGKLSAVINIGRDVTARMQNEEKMRRIEQERQALLERTLQISDLRSSLITQAAHELKTPLTSILGWAEILCVAKKQGKDVDVSFTLEGLESILKNAERLHKIVNDFLDVERIESGRFELSIQDVSFSKILQSAVLATNHLAHQKNIAIGIEELSTTTIPLDYSRMEQVLIHLLSNAVKYSPQNSHVWIKTKIIERNKRKMLQVRIIDEGYGFTTEELAEATTSFGKIYTQQEQKKTIQGAGFGLFIGRRIIEQHGGSLLIHSKGANFGTEFEICLPLNQN